MKTKTILMSTAISTLLAFGAVTAQAADDNSNKEKCFGVAAAGENSCAANGHSCQGQAKTSKDPAEWKYVDKDKCATMGGSTTAGKTAS